MGGVNTQHIFKPPTSDGLNAHHAEVPRAWVNAATMTPLHRGGTQRVMDNIQNTEPQQKGKPVTW